jgi:hypothetical protein
MELVPVLKSRYIEFPSLANRRQYRMYKMASQNLESQLFVLVSGIRSMYGHCGKDISKTVCWGTINENAT